MKKSPLTIGIDLDDVLLDFNSSLCVFHNQKYGTNYKLSDITKFRFEEIWNITFEQIVARIAEFYEHDLHWNSTPIPGAVSAIEKLQQKHRLIIVTAKPDSLKDKTAEWLQMHYGNAFASVHFIGSLHGNKDGKKRTKREVCDELGIDMFIEDSMENAVNIASPTRPVFLLDKPWNQGELVGNIKRVKGWEGVMEVLG